MSAPSDKPRFAGGGSMMLAAGALGLAGLALTGVKAAGNPKTALYAYLVAFAFWLGLSLAALVLLMILHAAKARWTVALRRPVEVGAASVAIFPLLFVPIALGFRILYPWAGHHEGLDEETLHLLHHRAPYLNPTFFFVRAAIYFFVWILVSQLLLRWSTRQDESGDPKLTERMWKLGPGALPAVAITLTFAAIDWLMTISMQWFSSMWGVYYFAGSFVAVLSLLVIALVSLDGTPALEGVIKPAHWLSLGKFMLAFTCFWAYIAFSQYMLSWITNLPHATAFLIPRQQTAWRYIGWALMAGHFGIPFILLLQRDLKFKPRRLAAIGAWILVMHAIDLHWVVMPQVRPEQPLPDWSNLTAFVGVGGVAIAFALFLMRGRRALPVKDPFLEESLGYKRT
jgi:hypothetical protein